VKAKTTSVIGYKHFLSSVQTTYTTASSFFSFTLSFHTFKKKNKKKKKNTVGEQRPGPEEQYVAIKIRDATQTRNWPVPLKKRRPIKLLPFRPAAKLFQGSRTAGGFFLLSFWDEPRRQRQIKLFPLLSLSQINLQKFFSEARADALSLAGLMTDVLPSVPHVFVNVGLRQGPQAGHRSKPVYTRTDTDFHWAVFFSSTNFKPSSAETCASIY